jgi:hypothetical protein
LIIRASQGGTLNSDLLQGFYLKDLLVEPVKGQISGRAGSAHLPPKAMEVLLCLDPKIHLNERRLSLSA